MLEQTLKTKLVLQSDPATRALFLKKIFLVGLKLVSAGMVASLVFRFLSFGGSTTQGELLLFIALALLWLGLYLVGSLVFSWGAFLFLSLVEMGIVLIPFLRFLEPGWLGVLLVLFCGLGWLARRAGKKLVDNSLKITPTQIVAVSRSELIFILSLLLALIWWSARLGNQAIVSGKVNFVGLVSDFPLNPFKGKTLDEIAESWTEKQLGKVLETMVPSNLSGSQLETVKQRAKQEIKTGFLKELSGLVGQSVSGQETIPQLIETSLSLYFQKLPPTTQRAIGLVVLVILFSFWFGLFHLFGFVVDIFFWSILEILLLLKVIKVGVITVEKEVITF